MDKYNEIYILKAIIVFIKISNYVLNVILVYDTIEPLSAN